MKKTPLGTYGYRLILYFYLVLAGCASRGSTPGPEFTFEPIPQEKALVYIYKQPSFATSGTAYVVRSDTETIALVTNGGYYPYLAEPGQLTIYGRLRLFVLENERRLISLPVEAGKVYYLRFEFADLDPRARDTSTSKPAPRLVHVAGAIGAWEIQGLQRFQKR